MPKKNDDRVGDSDGPAFNGGRQTAQQADIVKQEGGGLTDKERHGSLEGDSLEGESLGGKILGGLSRRSDPAVGGSSNGHSDQLATGGPMIDHKVAGGLSLAERARGTGEQARDKHRPD